MSNQNKQQIAFLSKMSFQHATFRIFGIRCKDSKKLWECKIKCNKKLSEIWRLGRLGRKTQ